MITLIKKPILVVFSICFLLSSSVSWGGEEQVIQPISKIIETKRLESINAVQIKLSNGMTFALKSTDSDTDEVFFKEFLFWSVCR